MHISDKKGLEMRLITEATKKVGVNVYDRFLSISAVSSVVNAFKVMVLALPS